MKSRVKIISKSTKRSSQHASFGIVRQLSSDTFYNNINKDLYEKFSGNHKFDTYNSIEEIPILKPLIETMKDDIKAPADVSPTVYIGAYKRDSGTFIQPPKKECAIRILVNLGYEEVYHFLPQYKIKEMKEIVNPITKEIEKKTIEKMVDTGLNQTSLYLKANSYAILGGVNQCNYLIKVNDKPIRNIANDIHGKPDKPAIRPRDYKRITIVFDYLVTADIMESLNNVLASVNIPKVKINAGSSPKMVEAEIKKMRDNIAKDSLFKKQVDDIMNQGNTINPTKEKDKEIDFEALEKEVLLSLETDRKLKEEQVLKEDILAEMNDINQ